MVVFHVSTFILQLHTAGGYDFMELHAENEQAQAADQRQNIKYVHNR